MVQDEQEPEAGAYAVIVGEAGGISSIKKASIFHGYML